jgi:hypothetical protein
MPRNASERLYALQMQCGTTSDEGLDKEMCALIVNDADFQLRKMEPLSVPNPPRPSKFALSSFFTVLPYFRALFCHK